MERDKIDLKSYSVKDNALYYEYKEGRIMYWETFKYTINANGELEHFDAEDNSIINYIIIAVLVIIGLYLYMSEHATFSQLLPLGFLAVLSYFPSYLYKIRLRRIKSCMEDVWAEHKEELLEKANSLNE